MKGFYDILQPVIRSSFPLWVERRFKGFAFDINQLKHIKPVMILCPESDCIIYGIPVCYICGGSQVSFTL